MKLTIIKNPLQNYKILTILVVIVFGLLWGSDYLVQADTRDFRIELETTYLIDESGSATVSHLFTITNLTPTVFLRQYALKTNYPDLRNVHASSQGQVLPASVATTDQSTSIALTFPDEIVGEGQRRRFSITYQTDSLATVGGQVMEVHIPQLGTADYFDQQKVVIAVPERFGKPQRITPQTDNIIVQNQRVVTTLDNVEGQAISLLFGEEQFFDLNLNYYLENPGTSEALAQIAIPPDTTYQRLHYQKLDPLPERMHRDPDGNWIATYRLAGGSSFNVELLATAWVTLTPQPFMPTGAPLPAHTRSQPYWETEHSRVKDLAQQYQTAEEIYDYVTKSLQYSSLALENEPQRLGAVAALAQPTMAVCQEFTDTFIAIARAAQIPARRLTGFAYTQNEALRPLSLEGDILHAWPEYFDKDQNRWRPIDPTWGNTTGGIDYFNQFDLNHIVFAINGLSSTTPYAAGTYKKEREGVQDVRVTFAQSFPETNPQLEVRMEPQKFLGVNLPGVGRLVITNLSGQAWYDLELNLEAASVDQQQIEGGSQQTGNTNDQASKFQLNYPTHLDSVLPFQTISVPIYISSSTQSWSKLPQWSVPVQVAVKIESVYAKDQILPNPPKHLINAGPPIIASLNTSFVVGLGLVAFILAVAAGSVLVFRQ